MKDAQLRIKFKYIPFTLGELKRKKADFDESIPKVNFEKSHVSGLLKSGRLDGFSQAYYENLLNNSEATLHPSEIIDMAERTVNSVKGIVAFNSKFENISDEYINIKVDEYQKYIDMLNSSYIEKDIDREIYKSRKQLYHDVFLREVIEYLQRKSSEESPKTISEVKFLGVTLDKLLMKYDKTVLGRNNKDFIIPNFYLPSFLLSKLYRLLPVQTENYKKAFIKAIATFSFFESTEKSREVQKFVNYFRSQGLNDERVLLSFITDEFFLNKFFNDDTQKDDFFESELNKKISDIENKYNEAEEKKEYLERSQAATLEEKRAQQNQILEQNTLIDILSENQRVLANSIKKMQQKKLIETRAFKQLNITDTIEENKLKTEVNNLKSILSERVYKDNMDEYVSERWDNQEVKKDRWLVAVLFWLPVPVCYYLIDRYTDPIHNLRVYLPVLTSLISFILSFLNKDDILFAFKYLFNPKKIRKKKMKEFSDDYKKINPPSLK